MYMRLIYESQNFVFCQVRHENRTFPVNKEKCTKIAFKGYCVLDLTKIEKIKQ